MLERIAKAWIEDTGSPIYPLNAPRELMFLIHVLSGSQQRVLDNFRYITSRCITSTAAVRNNHNLPR